MRIFRKKSEIKNKPPEFIDYIKNIPTDVVYNIKTGKSYSNCVNLLKRYKEFEGKSEKDLYELVYTAGTYFMAEEQIKTFINHFEYYRVSPIFDDLTCERCKEFQGKKFKIRERKAGINFPPFHMGCRCSFIIDIQKDHFD